MDYRRRWLLVPTNMGVFSKMRILFLALAAMSLTACDRSDDHESDIASEAADASLEDSEKIAALEARIEELEVKMQALEEAKDDHDIRIGDLEQ